MTSPERPTQIGEEATDQTDFREVIDRERNRMGVALMTDEQWEDMKSVAAKEDPYVGSNDIPTLY